MAADELTHLANRLARNIRLFRSRRRLRQEDMEQFGIPYKYYQSLERPAKRPLNITLRTLARLAKAFRVPVYRLLR